MEYKLLIVGVNETEASLEPKLNDIFNQGYELDKVVPYDYKEILMVFRKMG